MEYEHMSRIAWVLAAAAFVAGMVGGAAIRRSPPSEIVRSPSPPPERKPEAKTVPARVELRAPDVQPRVPKTLDTLVSMVDTKGLKSAIWRAALEDASIGRAALLELRSTEDPAYLDELKTLLQNLRDPAVRAELLAALAAERHPLRREALAFAVGSNCEHPDVHSTLLDLLNGTSEGERQSAMTLMRYWYIREPRLAERFGQRLHELAGANQPAAIRALSVRNLGESRREPDLRVVMEAVADPDAAVQLSAIRSLPAQYNEHVPLAIEQVRVLYQAATDPSRSEEVRKAAAKSVYNAARNAPARGTLTESEWAAIRPLLDPKLWK